MKRAVGFIGLGNMGKRMAKNVLKAKFELTVYDVRPEPMKELESLGAKTASSPRELGQGSNVVMVMVFDGTQLKEVVLGKNGLLEGLKKGSVIISSSSVKISEVKEVARAAAEKGVQTIDSPVGGGVARAEEGTLTMMVAGEKRSVDDCRDILETVGNDIYVVGLNIGMGQTAKIANQALVGVTFAGIAESLVLGVKGGIDPALLYDIIGSGVCGSPLFKSSAKHIMERTFESGSRVGTMWKDLEIVVSAGKELGVPLFTTASAYQIFQSAAVMLSPEEDANAIVKVLEKIAGIEVKKEP